MRLRSEAPGERVKGEVGDLEEVLMHVDERLRISVRRGKRGEEGVGDLLVSMTVSVFVGEGEETALVERRGDVERAARRRVLS